MTILSPEAYRALEDIVGPDYISREPADLDSYCFVWGNELLYGDKFSPRPPAVILPGSTEEVQAIVRTCNRFGLQYRAHASGFEVAALSAEKPFLPIDLRRMNRILAIDEKNRIAVIEPYVSQARLFLETRKKGLRPNMMSSGPSSSVMAGTAAHFGSGASNISTDYGSRNLLGVEWVLPDGEILRIGPLGCSGRWMNADGPGPSLRGALRGYGGANGGNGVFTRIATKLYPWYGPAESKPCGPGPLYAHEIPNLFEMFALFFPSVEKANDFNQLLYEASIAYHFQRFPVGIIPAMTTLSNDEFHAMLRSIPPEMLEAIGPHGATVALDAFSEEEMAYKLKVFHKILEMTDAQQLPLDEAQRGVLYNHVLNGGGVLKVAFRPTGSFMITGIGDEAMDPMGTLGKQAWDAIVGELHNSGAVFNASPNTSWAVTYGEGSGHVESLVQYDPASRESVRQTVAALKRADHMVAEMGLGINSLENALSYCESALKAAMQHHTLDFVKYMKRIKHALDPNNASEPAFYVSPEEWK
ncbi:MAG: FAD-binding oxidoreductase [Thermodesulfobacteriota bacterium]